MNYEKPRNLNDFLICDIYAIKIAFFVCLLLEELFHRKTTLPLNFRVNLEAKM